MKTVLFVLISVGLAVCVQAQTPNYPFTFQNWICFPAGCSDYSLVAPGLEGIAEVQVMGDCDSGANPWVVGSVWAEGCSWVTELVAGGGITAPVGYYDGYVLIYADAIAASGDTWEDVFGIPVGVYDMWERADCYDDATIENIPPMQPC
jgi:hypothetical protein